MIELCTLTSGKCFYPNKNYSADSFIDAIFTSKYLEFSTLILTYPDKTRDYFPYGKGKEASRIEAEKYGIIGRPLKLDTSYGRLSMLQDAIHAAGKQRYSAPLKEIALFEKGKIDTLFLSQKTKIPKR